MRKAKITYNPETDSYEIHINVGDGWGFDCSFRCVEKKDSKTESKDFIHFSFVSKMAELQHQGYTIDFTKL